MQQVTAVLEKKMYTIGTEPPVKRAPEVVKNIAGWVGRMEAWKEVLGIAESGD